MSTVYFEQDDAPDVVVNLREPYWAALLAWLWPGAGHFYQRRYTKGLIFMICVLGIFFYGLGLGRGRSVYASWKENDKRWQYVFQLGVGAPAMPALVQNMKTRDGGDPYFVLCERYPDDQKINPQKRFTIIENEGDYTGPLETYKDGLMAPPAGKVDLNEMDVLGAWHREMGHRFEIGTLFAIVAGLLNLLAVYDAFAGPAIMRKEERPNRRRRTDDEPTAESPPETSAENKKETAQPATGKRPDKRKPKRKKSK